MKANIHNLDRILRILIAVVCFVLYYNNLVTGVFGITLLVLSVVFILTALVGFCPIYKVLGISTKKQTLTH